MGPNMNRSPLRWHPLRWLSRLSLLALLIAAAVVALRPEEGRADEDNIPDQVVVVQRQIVVEVPYSFGNIAQSADIIRVAALRDQDQILISGRVPGSTNLIVYDQTGVLRDEFEVTVIPANLSTVMDNVQSLLNDIEGISFKIVNNQVYIQGEVATDEELSRVEDLASRERLVESMVTLSPIAQRLLAGLIETEIDTPGVAARLINDRIILEGVVHSDASSARAEAIARAYYPNIENVLEVREVERVPGRTKTVVIIAHYVELAKSLTRSWGIEWTPLAAQDGGLDLFFSRNFIGGEGGGWTDLEGYASGSVSALLPRLSRARASGYARVLENPTISVKSGEPAYIFSGQDYPYLISQGLTNTVEFQQIGIQMDVTPYAQGNDVDLDINISVTALGEVAANGLATITRSELSTSEYCRAGESIVIGGLQRISDTRDYNRVPETDVAGSLFTLYQSRDYKKSKSQFLVFLTPQIHESSSSANREIKDQFHLEEVRQ
jgi:pilus assembly protein CpaC